MAGPTHVLNWQFGWWLLLFAFVTGAGLGLFFHRDDFLGGYNSFRRRIVRLGRIAWFHHRRRRHASRVLSHRLARIVPASVLHPRGCADARRRVHHPWRRAMKIGFLAMSGIRAHDPALLELGLTLPGFVERSKSIASLPSLCLLYLAACTPAGHDLHYFEAEADGKEPADVYRCDLVAISTFSAQVFEAYAIADRLRQGGVKV